MSVFCLAHKSEQGCDLTFVYLLILPIMNFLISGNFVWKKKHEQALHSRVPVGAGVIKATIDQACDYIILLHIRTCEYICCCEFGTTWTLVESLRTKRVYFLKT